MLRRPTRAGGEGAVKPGDAPRIVLIFDVWHPDLTPKEVKFPGFLQNAMMRAGKRLSEAVRDGGAQTEGGDDFFSVIDAAREVAVDESKVWSMHAEFNSG